MILALEPENKKPADAGFLGSNDRAYIAAIASSGAGRHDHADAVVVGRFDYFLDLCTAGKWVSPVTTTSASTVHGFLKLLLDHFYFLSPAD